MRAYIADVRGKVEWKWPLCVHKAPSRGNIWGNGYTARGCRDVGTG
jgi:hypothetical protein